MKPKTILSLEQALSLPYATQRFVHLGWRVIRIESTSLGGDPNRYIGADTGIRDLHTYFIAPNLGKEAITLNLKMKEGQELLKKLIKELNVDIFLCNTLPMRYKQLGIDFETLSEANPNLIWCGISALGPDYPEVAGYDPALQAMLGFMEMTGDPAHEPMLCGLPVVDLKAGDEAFTQVLLALLEQHEHTPYIRNPEGLKKGKEIFISMAQCLTSWLITALPELTYNPEATDRFTRSGNEHRSFIPCNCYQTNDGYVYLAIGSDKQWEKFTKIRGFEHCFKPERVRNEGRKHDKENIYEDIRKGAKLFSTLEFLNVCNDNNLAVAQVNTIREVANLEFVKNSMINTTLPSGEKVSLFPAPMKTDFLVDKKMSISIAPLLGEHNEKIYKEIGLSEKEIEELKANDII